MAKVIPFYKKYYSNIRPNISITNILYNTHHIRSGSLFLNSDSTLDNPKCLYSIINFNSFYIILQEKHSPHVVKTEITSKKECSNQSPNLN